MVRSMLKSLFGIYTYCDVMYIWVAISPKLFTAEVTGSDWCTIKEMLVVVPCESDFHTNLIPLP